MIPARNGVESKKVGKLAWSFAPDWYDARFWQMRPWAFHFFGIIQEALPAAM